MSVFHNIYQDKLKEKYEEIKQNDLSTSLSIKSNYFSTAQNTFSWGNLPETVLPFLPEEYMLYWESMAFFKDDEEKYKIYPCFPAGSLLENGQYEEYTIIAKNGKQWRRNIKDIEICYNNSLRIPSAILIEEYAKNTSDAFRAVRNALERSMKPPIISCTNESEAKMLTEMYSKKGSELPFRITFSESFKNGNINLVKFFDNREYDVISLWDVATRNNHFFYSIFGISLVDISKKERLTEAEGSSNDEITRYTLLQSMYNCRKDFVERVEKHFNYKLELQLNRDMKTVYEITTNNEKKIEDYNIELSKGSNIISEEKTKEGENNEIES